MTIRQNVISGGAHGFLRSLGVLVSGTVFAHGITALALPIVTRLYTPHDFSAMAVFVALLGLIGGVACLRFEVAIPLPENKEDAANIFGLALTCSAVVSALLAVVVLAVPGELAGWAGQPALRHYLWLLPIGVILYAWYSALQFWTIRGKDFASLAGARVAQSGVAAAVQIALGWIGAAPLGLFLSQTLNSAAGGVTLVARMVRDREVFRRIGVARMRVLFSEYSRFPKFSTLEALSNGAASQLPIIFIAALALGPEAGFLMLAMSVMQAPMGLIGSSIAQVYLSRAPEEHRAGQLGTFTLGVFGGLLRSGVGPIIFAGIVAPTVFAIIFGEEWRRAGVLAMWMTPSFVMQFLAGPISMSLHVTNHQKSALFLQLFGLIVRVGSIYVASLTAEHFIAEVFALSGFVHYLAYLAVVWYAIAVPASLAAQEIARALPVILLWAAGGWAVAMAANTGILLFRP